MFISVPICYYKTLTDTGLYIFKNNNFKYKINMNINLLKTIIFSVMIFYVSESFAQVKSYHLTHAMSEEEKGRIDEIGKYFQETDPPSGQLRNIAEFEPMEGVIITYDYDFGIPYNLIAEMSEDVMVTTIVSGQSQETTVINYYTSNGVNLDNCDFLYSPIDSWWTRDYGPWFIAEDDSTISIIDFPYNRPRPNDDDIPIKMAEFLDIDLYGMNVTQAGGNYMCDGYGQAVSTDLVWEENASQTHDEIAQKKLDYLGIENYHVRPDPLDDYIKHIDCWGKYLGVDKILIGEVPASDYRYADYEAAAEYWETQTSSWGNYYRVYRVYTPGNTTPYTNSLILNNKVFVPLTGSQWDDEAIISYQEAMPGYEIIGINYGGWYDTDALHCRTHEVADREMLYIKHYPILGEVPLQEEFIFNADITSYGGDELTSGFPILKYKIDNGDWQEILMTLTTGITFTASISGLESGTEVAYYIHAENENGKSENHPYIGEPDPHIFTVSGNSVPVADAGENQTVNSFDVVTLDGSASYDADNDELTYSWTAPSDISLSSVTDEIVTFEAPELTENIEYEFTLTVNDGTYESLVDIVTVEVFPYGTGISINKKNNFEIIPNPNSGYFILKTEFENAKITIYQIDGKCIFNNIITGNKNYIDISNIAKGIYFIKLETNNKQYIEKIIVK